MAEFHQNGSIATLPRLGDCPVEHLEAKLMEFGQRRGMSLILPSLYSELQGTALPRIVETLEKVPYLEEIIIGLDAADESQFRHAREFFSRLPQHHRILWNDGPRMQHLLAELDAEHLAPERPGKGANVWLCMGYFLASARGRVLAMHDCDIESYDREMLARLFYPVAHPNFAYKFVKGYYARVADNKLHGRVARLLMTPLIRALIGVTGPLDFLTYMDSFRYPLSGECAMTAGVAETIRIPNDWGLEVGILAELHRSFSANAICQVDIAGNYEHKHQKLSADNPNEGLAKMSTDIAKALYRKLATHGVVLTPETIRTIKAMYLRTALDFIERFYVMSQINGLDYDRHAEEKTVEVFVQSIIHAGEQFLANPMEVPFIPTWNRVRAAFPDFPERIKAAVEADMQMA